jgi:glycosyltransferase involved in cell wall biosynthesis
MKKICFVATVHGTLQGFVLKFAEYMHNKMGCEIHFICNPDEKFCCSLPEYIHFHAVSMKRGISVRGIQALNQMVTIFKREKFDLVQYSTPNASFYASAAAKLAGVPVRLYCQWGMVYVSMKGLARQIFKGIEKLTCRLSTHVEPDSFGNLRFGLEEKLYPAEKGSVVWNGSTGGIDLQQFDIAQKQLWRSEIRARYNIPEDVFLYGFVGRITRDKGINELLVAFQTVLKAHPTARLMIVGGIEHRDLLDKALLNWAENCPNVVFTGVQQQIEQFYSAFDAFVLPSYREGFGSVIIEAEAMEVPVIATQIPGPIEAMQKDHTGFMVPKQDPDALGDAMCRLLENPLLCAKLGKAGRTYVADRFEQQTFYRYTLEDRMKMLGIPEKQKKVCFVTTVHGTLQAFVLKLAEYLHENANYDISFICNPN